MEIDVQARGFSLTDAIRAVVRGEASGFRRIAGAHRVQVRLFDVNGRRGGVDKCCQVTLRLSREQRVVVARVLDADLYRAIPAAFDTARRAALGAVARRTRGLRRRVAQAAAPAAILAGS